MTSEIFTEWACSLTNKMRNDNRNILIFLDNATSHKAFEYSNVKFAFFSPNLTSEVQPLDQGIINSFKAYYRGALLKRRLLLIDECINGTEFTKKIAVLDAVKWAAQSCESVSVNTISNCFVKAGFQLPNCTTNSETMCIE